MLIGESKPAFKETVANESNSPQKTQRTRRRALLGVARLQAAVGMTSLACRAYQVVFEHPTDLNLLAEVAVEALETASKLPSRESLDVMVRLLSAYPAIVASQPALAKWFPRPVAEPTPVSIAPTPVAVTIAAPKPDTIPEPVAPVARRRSFAEWIAVFMEERNLLWGALIGGTLVVGCSVALVISFWQKLEQIPFSPFFIIAAITCSLFGAGLYTLHHWKLQSTSRGLLLIAMLLTPLNFLVLAGLTREEGAGWVGYAMAGSALVVLGGFLHRAGRILVRDPLDLPMPSAEIMTASVLVSSVAQLAAPIAMARTGGADAAIISLRSRVRARQRRAAKQLVIITVHPTNAYFVVCRLKILGLKKARSR